MKKTRYITEGAILLALFTVMLLVSLYIPLIGGLFSLLLGVPFLVFTARHGWKKSILFLISSLALTALFGTVLLMPTTLLFGIGGVVIGELYNRGKSRYLVLLGGTVAFSINIVLLFVITSVVANVNILNEFQNAFNESMKLTQDMLGSLGQEASKQQMQMVDEFFETIQYLLPSFFVIIGFAFSFITQGSAAPILRKIGHPIAKFPPFRDFKLPKNVLWYYLLIMVLSLLDMEKGSFLYISVGNIATVLQQLMVVQGFALIFYYFHQKSFGKWVPITIVILSLMSPFFLQFIRILGIIDLGFDLRNIKNKK